MVNRKFDVIVVGAGPAGSACALTAARAGLDVLLLERGEYPGAKNVMGGVLYRKQLEELVPEFWTQAPVERPIVEQRFWMLGEESLFHMGYKGMEWSQAPYNNFTVLRAKFDQWFDAQAVEAGALLVTETVVKECLVEDGKVIGIRTDRPDGDVYADAVVLCDGVNSLLAKQLGFHKELKSDEVALAAMEVMDLPAEKIEDRFNLEPNQGCTIEIFGDGTKGILGTAFLYTNKDSINIGVGATLSGLIHSRLRPYDLLEYVKNHSMIKPYIKDAKSAEYAAHLIPEGGFHAMPKLVGNGVLICGDAGQLVNGIHREGSNMAMTSGRLAAETIIFAKQANDFSENMLGSYRKNLMNSYVGKDLEKYKNATHTFEHYPQYFRDYIPFVNRAASEFFTVDGVPKREKQRKILSSMVEGRGKWQTIQDLYRAWKVMK